MNIAVTYENGEIFQHFGHTKQFKVYNISDGEITNTEIVDSGNSGHGALATLLANYNIDILICGGIGGGAQAALAEAGIKLYGGVCGSADEAVEALLGDNLQYNPDVKCNHHGDDHQHNCHSHEDSNHQCGSSSHHGCGGGHSCH
ncbi:MAG: NifB/NifX family molybdenum-iron cluster-binding protein [Anaerovoracaceae bacterium]